MTLHLSSLNSIAIVLNSYFGPFMTALAALLKEKHGSSIHLYVKSDILVNQYRSGPFAHLFDSVSNFMVLRPALRHKGLNEQSELLTARDWETRLGSTYNTLALANRHVGRGYALGGFNHPRSSYIKSSYLQMVHAYNVQLGYWEHEFTSKKTTLVLADNKEIACVARALGIPYRTMARSRYENLHYWEEAEYREAAPTWRAFSRQAPSKCTLMLEEEAIPDYQCAKVFIKRAMRNMRWRTILYLVLQRIARRIYWLLRGYEKAREYYLSDEIVALLRQRRDIKRMMGQETCGLEALAGRPFFFYPLHTEPEQALGQISPEFFFQLEAIAIVSRDLPAGVTLAVKEVANACGRRPPTFYDQILSFKNVVMLNLDAPGADVVHHALGTVTIAGTAGLEAALLGKPVISFGRHNPYNGLDHVYVVRDTAEVSGVIRRIVDGDWDRDKARVDAARFLAAHREVSFDMGEFDYIHFDQFPADAPREAYERLVRGLVETGQGATS